MNLQKTPNQAKSDASTAARVFGFMAAVAAGAVLGWVFFLSPAEAPEGPISTATPKRSMASPPANVLVPSSPTSTPRLGSRIAVGSQAPDFQLSLLEGGEMSLGDHTGEVVLLNFWATWCPPCRVEMPALQEAYDELGAQGFTVLAVNWTESDDVDLIGPYAQELELSFPILLDEESLVTEDLYNVIGFPTSIFIDRDGTVREIVIGPLALDELRGKIEALLDEAP
jgi:peroxiredoxin